LRIQQHVPHSTPLRFHGRASPFGAGRGLQSEGVRVETSDSGVVVVAAEEAKHAVWAIKQLVFTTVASHVADEKRTDVSEVTLERDSLGGFRITEVPTNDSSFILAPVPMRAHGLVVE